MFKVKIFRGRHASTKYFTLNFIKIFSRKFLNYGTYVIYVQFERTLKLINLLDKNIVGELILNLCITNISVEVECLFTNIFATNISL